MILVYGKYNEGIDRSVGLYASYDPNDPDQFNKYHRLKLLLYLLRAPPTKGGCNMSISQLLLEGYLSGFYPLHNHLTLASMRQFIWDPW